MLFQASYERSSVDELAKVNKSPVGGLSLFSSVVLPLGSGSSPSLNVGWRRSHQAVNNSSHSSTLCFDHIACHSFYHMHSYGVPIDKHTDHLQSYDWYITSKCISNNVEFLTAFLCDNIITLNFTPKRVVNLDFL